MIISHDHGTNTEQLMLSAAEPENQLKKSHQSMGRTINREDDRVTGNNSYSRNTNIRAGNENWREKYCWEVAGNLKVIEEPKDAEGQNKSDEEEADNGPNKATERPKGRKWKLQARNPKVGKGSTNGPINAK